MGPDRRLAAERLLRGALFGILGIALAVPLAAGGRVSSMSFT